MGDLTFSGWRQKRRDWGWGRKGLGGEEGVGESIARMKNKYNNNNNLSFAVT